MIDIKVIGSGSRGNCYLADINNTKILLEAGLPFKNIQKALNYKLSEVDACLITHEHLDHAKAAKDLMKVGIDCYMTVGSFEGLKIDDHHRRKKFYKNPDGEYSSSHLGRLIIKPFEAVHDVIEPVNFFITDCESLEKMMFITDTAYIKYRLPDVDVLMVECNYVKSILDKRVEEGKLHVSLRNRIVRNHMSLETLLEALKQATMKKLKKVYVLHLSDSNSDEKMILEAIQKATGVVVEVC